MDEQPRLGTRRRVSEGVVIALITAGGTIVASIVTGGFGLAGNGGPDVAAARPAATVTVTTTQPQEVEPTTSESTVDAPSAAASASVTYLTDLQPVGTDGDYLWAKGPVRIDGRDYSHGVATVPSFCEKVTIDYALSREYTRFHAVAGFTDASPNTGDTSLELIIDGVLKDSETLRVGQPVTVNLDVRHAVRLGIIIEPPFCHPVGVALGDPKLSSS